VEDLRVRLLISIIILVVLLPAPASAQNKLALVIGVSDYGKDRANREAEGFIVPPKLYNAVRDSELIAGALTDQGFQVTKLRNPDKRALLKAINAFATKIQEGPPDTLAIFYFAGHGTQGRPPIERDIDNYLIPIGADLIAEADLESEALGLRRISEALSPRLYGSVIIILDACRDFALPQRERSASATRGLAEQQARPGTLIAYSTAPGTRAKDGVPGRNGPYATALAEQLRKSRGDRIEDIFINVRNAVWKSTRNEQQTWESNTLRRYVTIGSPEGKQSEFVSLQAAWANNNVAELKAFLGKFPNSSSRSLVEDRIWLLDNVGSDTNEMARQSQQAVDAETIKLLTEFSRLDRATSEFSIWTTFENLRETYSLESFLRAALAGDAMANAFLGGAFDQGLGVNQDYVRARKFYDEACDSAIAEACGNLGYFYDQGWGVKRDYARAREFYNKSCEGGIVGDCISLERLYANARSLTEETTLAPQASTPAQPLANSKVPGLKWNIDPTDPNGCRIGVRSDLQGAERQQALAEAHDACKAATIATKPRWNIDATDPNGCRIGVRSDLQGAERQRAYTEAQKACRNAR
tara:strand:+ start:458 stop:2212 length:1755 start_codon:yes stop_codon:yes gene_type:complete